MVVVRGEGSPSRFRPRLARVVDTTGAGDLYAAGFLRGLTTAEALAECARMGHLAAAEIISHYGGRPETPLSDYVAAPA